MEMVYGFGLMRVAAPWPKAGHRATLPAHRPVQAVWVHEGPVSACPDAAAGGAVLVGRNRARPRRTSAPSGTGTPPFGRSCATVTATRYWPRWPATWTWRSPRSAPAASSCPCSNADAASARPSTPSSHAELDTGYLVGISVSREPVRSLPITPHDRHASWSCTIAPAGVTGDCAISTGDIFCI